MNNFNPSPQLQRIFREKIPPPINLIEGVEIIGLSTLTLRGKKLCRYVYQR